MNKEISPAVNFSSALDPLKDVHNATKHYLIQLAKICYKALSSCTSFLCWIHIFSDEARWLCLSVLHSEAGAQLIQWTNELEEKSRFASFM